MSSHDDPELAREITDNLDALTFDEWCALHQSDPQRFDACRLKMLNDLIDAASAESRPRLRGLMFKMEGEARRSKSQLGYNLRLASMMMEMLDEMREQLHQLVSADVSELDKSMAKPGSADIIPFAALAAKRESG